MNIKTKLGSTVDTIQKELRELIKSTEFDWTRVIDEKGGPSGNISYKGTLNNLTIEVKPAEVVFMITRPDDPEGKMTEKRILSSPDKNIKSALFLELEHRFSSHNDYNFFSEAKKIIEEANLAIQQELEQKKDKKSSDEPKQQPI